MCSAIARRAAGASPARIASTIASCWAFECSRLGGSSGIRSSSWLTRVRASAIAVVREPDAVTSAIARCRREALRRGWSPGAPPAVGGAAGGGGLRGGGGRRGRRRGLGGGGGGGAGGGGAGGGGGRPPRGGGSGGGGGGKPPPPARGRGSGGGVGGGGEGCGEKRGRQTGPAVT